MLNLIYGPSGSGKSALITDLIRQDVINGKRCYLLLPEQQAYISERDLPKKLPQNAGLYFKIVNFSGLCEDVFQKYGGCANLTADKTSRAILMWETIRSLSGALKHYAKSAKSGAALTESMLAAIEELQNNGADSETLEKIAAELPQKSPLAQKLYDLAAISAVYSSFMNERFGESQTDRFFHLAKTLREHDFFSGATLYIDSFTSFTAPEYAVLTELIRQCESVTVGLCADSLDHPSIHFRSVNETAKRLKKCADQANSPTRKSALTNENNCRPTALRVLERDLWRFDLAKEKREILPDGGKNCIDLLACSNMYEESEAVALNILELVQNGMHYGDLAVFVRDTEQYRGVLDAALERYGIPFFFSDRTELSSKPLSRLILSALRAVNGNYRLSDVITLVKTGLCGVTERDAALFEEYCETWHISGKRFLDPVWNMNPDGLETHLSERAAEILETANRVRKIVILPLQKLQAELRSSNLLSDRLRALYNYLYSIDLSAKLSDLAEEELSLGQVREAGESLRLFDLVKDSFVLLCKLLPNTPVTNDEVQTLLEIVFSHSDLGSVPAVHDCVLIGSAAVARAEGVRAAFLLGLTEGDFPRSVQSTGILSDSDQKILQEHGLDLNADPELRSSEELFYVYRAITKPLEKLYLSYPMLDAGGNTKTPSQAFRRVCFLTDRKENDFHFHEIFQKPVENTEKNDAERYHLAAYTSTPSLYLSKTKINTFVKCPYSYYSQYVLKLREKKDSNTTYANDGTFIHFVFEKFLDRMAEPEGYHFPTETEELESIVSEIVLEYLHSVCPFPLSEVDPRLLHLFSRLQALSVAMLQAVINEIRDSIFIPKYFEEKIGGDVIPPLALPLSGNRSVQLSGSIDRVDLCKKGEKTYVRIIDYKTGKAGFKLSDVESGKDMQLVFYLYAATQIDPAHFVPAGAYYLQKDKSDVGLSAKRSGFLLDDVDLSGNDPVKSEWPARNEVMSQDRIAELINGVCGKIVEISEQILNGNAPKTPGKSACQYCIVRETCDQAVRDKYD